MLATMKPMPMLTGPEKDFLQKQNGKKQQAGMKSYKKRPYIHGEIKNLLQSKVIYLSLFCGLHQR
jgi:hypothetical protein